MSFTRSDLKDGMVITYNSGEKRLLIGDRLFEKNNCDYYSEGSIYAITDDLRNEYTPEDYYIVSVEYMDEVVWERN